MLRCGENCDKWSRPLPELFQGRIFSPQRCGVVGWFVYNLLIGKGFFIGIHIGFCT